MADGINYLKSVAALQAQESAEDTLSGVHTGDIVCDGRPGHLRILRIDHQRGEPRQG